MNEPLLSENESLTLRVLLRLACGIEIQLPSPENRHSQDIWRSVIFQPLGEQWAAEMAAYRQKQLHSPR